MRRPPRPRAGHVHHAGARRRIAVVVVALLLGACNDVPEDGVVLRPPDSPERTAVQDRAVRALIMDVAEARACDELRGRYVPLPEDRPEGPSREEHAIVEGRVRVAECRVERRGDHLALHAEGRGWRWVDRATEGPFGSRFTARGHLRFEASIDVDAEVDLRYDERERRVLLALTPASDVRARIRPIGSLPVMADGGWSGVIGGLGGLLGAPIEQQARPMIEEQGAAMVERQLRSGATVALDLCTSQIDGALGALDDASRPAERPYPQGTERWLDNARAALRPGGLDLSGPWATEGRALRFDVEVESGGPASVAVLCTDEAERVSSEYLSGARVRTVHALAHGVAESRRAVALALQPGGCDEAVLMVQPSGDQLVRYRYRVRRDGEPTEAWVRCPH